MSIPSISPQKLFTVKTDASHQWQNRLYWGDNYPILLHLLNDDSIRGKVRLVYIDPPFSTNSVYESRSLDHAYHDNLTGANFLEFLRERLVLLYELLADDGSIYVHLDGNMAFQIKIIMDEIFGTKHFRSWITRKKCNRKNYTRKSYGNISDYILFYTKGDNYVWHRVYDESRHPKRIICGIEFQRLNQTSKVFFSQGGVLQCFFNNLSCSRRELSLFESMLIMFCLLELIK